MLALQASIGAFNDLADEAEDAGRKPGKPLPRGIVTRRDAWALGVTSAAAGLLLSGLSGVPTLLAAGAAAGLGWLYDAGLSRTPLSWLPLALALPLVPIHAWLGATGTVAPSLITLLPVAVLAGAALAIANGLVDVERDSSAGRATVAVAMGRSRAWAAHAALLLIVVAVALFLAPASPPIGGGFSPPGGPAPASSEGAAVLGFLRLAGVAIGALATGVGALLLRASKASIRERGWEAEAIGVACLGVGWLAGTAAVTAAVGAGT